MTCDAMADYEEWHRSRSTTKSGCYGRAQSRAPNRGPVLAAVASERGTTALEKNGMCDGIAQGAVLA